MGREGESLVLVRRQYGVADLDVFEDEGERGFYFWDVFGDDLECAAVGGEPQVAVLGT